MWDNEIRLYWIEQMEQAYLLMENVLKQPIDECGEDLVYLPDVVRENGVEVRFSQSKIAGRYERLFYLRAGLIEPFISIAREMNNRDLILYIEDAYRTPDMQRQLALLDNVLHNVYRQVLAECQGRIPDRDYFKRRLAILVAPCPKAGMHMAGSALDISVLDNKSGKPVDRGASYIDFTHKTPMDSPYIDHEARKNRELITSIMMDHDFIPYPYEFWHYSSGDVFAQYLSGSGKKGRYTAVMFDLELHKIEPLKNPLKPLIHDHELEKMLKKLTAGMDNIR